MKKIKPPKCKCGSTDLTANFSGSVSLKFKLVNGKPSLIYDAESENSEITDIACGKCGEEVSLSLRQCR